MRSRKDCLSLDWVSSTSHSQAHSLTLHFTLWIKVYVELRLGLGQSIEYKLINYLRIYVYILEFLN